MRLARRGMRHDEPGFTLVELLVAIAILALLSGLLLGGFRFGARAWERADSRIDNASEIQIVHSFLSRRLSEAVPVRLAERRREGLIQFSGDGRTLSFVSVLPVHMRTGGYSVLDLFLEPGERGDNLILRWRPFRFGQEAADAGEADERVLLAGIRSVEFAYFGASDEGDDAPVWYDTWRERRRLPELVRLRIAFDDESRAAWPELVAAPMVAPTPGRRR